MIGLFLLTALVQPLIAGDGAVDFGGFCGVQVRRMPPPSSESQRLASFIPLAEKIPVVIIGAGAAGQGLGEKLARSGISFVILDKSLKLVPGQDQSNLPIRINSNVLSVSKLRDGRFEIKTANKTWNSAVVVNATGQPIVTTHLKGLSVDSKTGRPAISSRRESEDIEGLYFLGLYDQDSLWNRILHSLNADIRAVTDAIVDSRP